MKRIICCLVVLVLLMQSLIVCSFAAPEDAVFSRMLERAEAIVNYEWIPAQRMDVWNESFRIAVDIFSGLKYDNFGILYEFQLLAEDGAR